MSEEVKKQNPSVFGMIWNPTEQFERIKERPKIWGALIIITILFMIGSWLTLLGVETTGIEGLTEKETEVIGLLSNVGIIIGSLFIPIISVLFTSFIYWIVTKIAKAEVTYRQLFSMYAHIMILSALSLIINGIISLLFGGASGTMYTGLSSMIDYGGAIGALVDSIELFSIWVLILTAIGLQKVANFSKGLSWSVVIGFYIVGILFSMIGAFLSDFMGSF